MVQKKLLLLELCAVNHNLLTNKYTYTNRKIPSTSL